MNDKQWSRYNTLFQSKRFGYFLYNAMSNVLLELDEAHYHLAQTLKDDPGYAGPSADADFVGQLETNGVIVHEGDEERTFMLKKYQRNLVAFNNARISLTICPTLACNFRCLYCFEQSQDDKEVMSAETMDSLIAKLKGFGSAKDIIVTWYGGEPTLAFDIVKSLTERFLALDITYNNASMVTNGYLLDRKKIDQLNDLRITHIQITLDGPAAIHDRRRVLRGGGPTFQRILNNVDALMNSSFEGLCQIRVNVDKNNLNEYAELRSDLMERFKGRKLSVYGAPVDTCAAVSYDRGCRICASEWGDFNTQLYHASGIVPRDGLYPPTKWFNVCAANHRNGYVVGPSGELYKCWDHVGRPQMSVGNVHLEDPITNPELVALYSLRTNPFEDPVCLACSVFPICGGGCVNKRLKAQHFKEEGVEFCSPYRDHLIPYLEAYYDAFRVREVCRNIFDAPGDSSLQKGFRMVQPKTIQQPSAEKTQSLKGENTSHKN